MLFPPLPPIILINIPSCLYILYIEFFSDCCFQFVFISFFLFCLFVSYEMYKYNSLLIYIIKIRKKNLSLEMRRKQKKENQVTNLIQNFALSISCRETPSRLLSYWLSVECIQILTSCDLDRGQWTALKWTVSTSLHSPTRWCFFYFYFRFCFLL